MLREKNQNTQPFRAMPVFNDWDVVAKGWYIACPSQDLRGGKPLSMDLCGQRVVLFRGEDGHVRCLDAFCPHMGTDLGIGRVIGNEIRCFFHHWRYDGSGTCTHVPVAEQPPRGARLQAYATQELYGFVWVFPVAEAPSPVVVHQELEDQEVSWVHGVSYERSCHHHVTMINGIDPQHLRTVHDLDIDLELELSEEEGRGVIDFTLDGALPAGTLRERIVRSLLGERYSYRMRYGHGTIGCLTVMKGVRLVPELYMLFAYRPLARGRTLVQPIYLTPRRDGFLGRVLGWLLLRIMKFGFYVLRDEDGLIYENMRFQPGALLAMDAPVSKFVAHVNRLEPSLWSRRLGAAGESAAGDEESRSAVEV
jgi:nitrite reductase/ring-hydroxylating ferredoxin subunit